MTDDTWVDEPPPLPPEPKQLTPEQRTKRAKNKVRRGAHVTATQLAQQLNISPRVMRSHLRALKLPKPEHGWAWPPGEAKAISAKIAKRLKRPAVLTPTVDDTDLSNVVQIPNRIAS